jgi:polysaccharide export outer membrane protein
MKNLPIASQLPLLATLSMVAIATTPANAAVNTLANGGSDGRLAQNRPESTYTLGAGDRIRVDIFNVPEYSGEFQVLVDGTLNLPIIGNVPVQNGTIPQVSAIVQNRYARYVRRPIVTISLIAPRPLQIALAGEVNRAGSYTIPVADIRKFPTISQAIQQAGGVSQSANLRRVQIRRFFPGAGYRVFTADVLDVLQRGNTSQDITLRDGDAIFVPTLPNVNARDLPRLTNSILANQNTTARIAIVGEIAKPGTYTLRGEQNSANPQAPQISPPKLTEAIRAAGGATLNADISQIRIRRRTLAGGSQIIGANLLSLIRGADPEQDVFLQDGDTILLPTNPRPNIQITQILQNSSFGPQVNAPVKVSIAGEINRPGTYTLRGDATASNNVQANNISLPTVSQVIQQANGVKPGADVTNVQLRRTARDGSQQVFRINLLEILSGSNNAVDLALQEGDRIIVPTSTSINPILVQRVQRSSLGPSANTPVRITVSGEINRPGNYTLRGESTAGAGGQVTSSSIPTVMQALQVANGIKPSASITQVQLRRLTSAGTEQVMQINILQLLEGGDSSLDLPLQDGDRIIVPVATAMNAQLVQRLQRSSLGPSANTPVKITVAGEVNRAGTYTLRGEATAAAGTGQSATSSIPTVIQAIQAANGIKPSAGVTEVQLRRITNNGTEQVMRVNLLALIEGGDSSLDLALQDGDRIIVPSSGTLNTQLVQRLQRSSLGPSANTPIKVAVSGEINRPGSYVLRGETAAAGATGQVATTSIPTVIQAIQAANGIKSTANIREIQLRRTLGNGTEQAYRIDLFTLLQGGDSTFDLALQDGDRIIIPQAVAMNPQDTNLLARSTLAPGKIKINVVGEVVRPGIIEVAPDTTLNQGILAAGGFNNARADKTKVELLRLNPNGTVTKRTIPLDFARGIDESVNPQLREDDVIVIGRAGITQVGDGVGQVISPLSPLLGILSIFGLFR